MRAKAFAELPGRAPEGRGVQELVALEVLDLRSKVSTPSW